MRRILVSGIMLMLSLCAGAEKVYDIYPVPHMQARAAGKAGLSSVVNVVAETGVDDATIRRAVDILVEHGAKVTVDAASGKGYSNVYIGVYGSGQAADARVDRLGIPQDVFSLAKYDRHILSLRADKSGLAQIVVLGENSDAAFCGLASLEQILDSGTRDLACVDIFDYADVKNRGIIEGYYGVPYSAEVTKDLFRFMARYKMNTYMYGAKSDPYHSRNWSDPYPDTITAEEKKIGYFSKDMLRDVAAASKAAKVKFIWAIHPGTAFTDPGSTDVVDRILDKFRSMQELGVTHFGVFVDDVGVPSDPSLLKLGADRLTALQDHVKTPLHYVPQLYAYSWVSRETARAFFESLKPVPARTNIYITGRNVWSVPNNSDVDVVRDFLGRPAGWWWNYPCNDNDYSKLFIMDMYANFRDERHIGNLSRMEDGIGAGTIIINPMQQGELSKIALFSVADYCWNNEAFDNSRSWEASLPAVFGKRAASFRTLAPLLRYFDQDALAYDIKNYKASVAEGNPRPASLISYMKLIRQECAVLKTMKDSDDESDRLLYQDMRPWLLKLDAMAAETQALLEGRRPAAADYENDPDFLFELLKGMGSEISLTMQVAEPSAECLRPFIDWLRAQ